MTWRELQEDKPFECGILQLRVRASAGSEAGALTDTRDNLKRFLKPIISARGAGIILYEGTRGVIALPIAPRTGGDELLSLALVIVNSAAAFNADPIHGNRLDSPITLVVACGIHAGHVHPEDSDKEIYQSVKALSDELDKTIDSEGLGSIEHGLIALPSVMDRVNRQELRKAFVQAPGDDQRSPARRDSSTDALPYVCKSNDYCLPSIRFPVLYRESHRTASPAGDHSDLFYLFLATYKFEACKKKVMKAIAQMERRDFHRIQLWSLLGSAELLLIFRHDDASIVKKLFDELKDDLEGIMGHDPNRSGHPNKDNFLLINVFEERTRAYPAAARGPSDGFEKRRLDLEKPDMMDTARSVKAFILLKIDGSPSVARNTLPACLKEYSDIVERFSFSNDSDCHWIIDVRMPCGRLWRLNELSSSLEPLLDQLSARKMTFLCYDLTPLDINLPKPGGVTHG